MIQISAYKMFIKEIADRKIEKRRQLHLNNCPILSEDPKVKLFHHN